LAKHDDTDLVAGPIRYVCAAGDCAHAVPQAAA
jgi:hypothetical protein